MKKKRGAGRSPNETPRLDEEVRPAPPLPEAVVPSAPTPPEEHPPASLPAPFGLAPAGRFYTRCPGCKTVYRITLAQLRGGRGSAHCQQCGVDFVALETLAETAARVGEGADLAGHTPLLGCLDAVAESAPPAWKPPSPAGDADASWTGAPASPVKKNSRSWPMGALSLLALLGLQAGVFEGPRWVQDEAVRPWLEAACQDLGCRLPAFRAPRLIRVIDHNLGPLADGGEGYEFSLVLLSQAPLPQSFPGIKLVLAGHNGKPVAARVFQPTEYLQKPAPSLMAVGTSYEVRLLLAKPDKEVGGFSVDLL